MANRFPGVEWHLADDFGKIGTWEKVSIAVLMDIRAELHRLNGLLACPNFLGIPHSLTQIERNTRRLPKKRRK